MPEKGLRAQNQGKLNEKLLRQIVLALKQIGKILMILMICSRIYIAINIQQFVISIK